VDNRTIINSWKALINALAREDVRIATWSRARFLVSGTILTLMLAAFFLSPRWVKLLSDPTPIFEWYRGMGFLLQCANPWRTDVEPALRARLLLPLIAHAVGLKGYSVFAIGWAGIIVLVLQTLRWTEGAMHSRLAAIAFAICMGTTSVVMVPMHWLGINDAWVWLGLLAVVFARASWAVPLACLLCPWVDERFVIGLPLAVWARARLDGSSFWKRMLIAVAWLVPFFVLRVFMHVTTDDGTSGQFLAAALRDISMVGHRAPLGWWMGLRAVWVLVAIALIDAVFVRCALWELTLVVGTVGISTFLAHDYSRSVAIVLPLLALGAVRFHQHHGYAATAGLIFIAAVNLVLPAAHIVGGKFHVPIRLLPHELILLF
jgi:hypothetical protein